MKKELEKEFESWANKNKGPYGKACVDVARKVMEFLDKGEPFDCYDLITKADNAVEAGGITGYMAGVVASAVSHFHERGEEFRKKWNEGYGVKDNKGTVNPAIMTLKD